ncbi:MAG: heavy metal translocating P-type ATPase [Candidatus Acidiferrales bacterium]
MSAWTKIENWPGRRRRRLSSAERPNTQQARFQIWGSAYFASVLSIVGIAVHLILRYALETTRPVYLIPLYLVLLAGGLPLAIVLLRKALAREFGSDLLAGISILTSVLLGEYLVGCIVVLMLSGGTAIEQLATRRASSVLDLLARRMPQIAHRRTGETLADVDLREVAIGDTLVVFPHEICPVDGVVLEGQGTMDEAYLTGEPFEILKAPGSGVLSGAMNGDMALTMRAEKLSIDSRYAKIMEVMKETQQRRPHLRRLGDRLGAWYTPVAVTVATVAWIISKSSLRFLAVLVVATPCPLLIAIPVVVIGAISLSARRGIIIKNPAVLEQIDRCQTLLVDKTGTLTYGKPTLSEINCAPGVKEREVILLAASLELYSKHPLAGAVLEAARKERLALEPATQISERPGEGLRGIVAGHEILITHRGKLAEKPKWLPPLTEGLECLLRLDGAYAAAFRFRDEPRKDSRLFLDHLQPRHGIGRIVLISGDRDLEVRRLGSQMGITEFHSAKSPEEKVGIVQSETHRAKTLYVGDGINDAPAMQAATVGVAFGHENEITAEAADAVILEPSLEGVDALMHIGRRMRKIALQSAFGGMALSILGMIAAALGYLPPIAGAVAQEVIDLLAVLNAVRMVLPFDALTDF